jgi:hypothetical protein
VAIKRDLGGAGTQKGDLDQFINNLADSIQTNQIASQADKFAVKRSPLAKKVAKVQGAVTGSVGAVAKGLTVGMEGADLESPYGKLQVATAGSSWIDEGFDFLGKVAYGYRQQVAPRLTAGLSVASPSYRERYPELASDFPLRDIASLSWAVPNSPLYKQAIEDARKPLNPEESTDNYFAARINSPGRALNLALADLVPGEQGAEKLNWEDGKEVQEFYDQGLPKFFSGIADFGFNWLDPTFVVTGTGTKAYKLLVKRPVTSKNVNQITSELEAAKNPNIQNSWSSVLDAIEEAADPATFNPSALQNLGVFGNATTSTTAKVAIDAQLLGGRELAADVLKVGVDLTGNSLDSIVAKSETIGAQLKHLKEKEEKLNQYVSSLLNPEEITPPLSSIKGLRKYSISAPPMGEDLIQANKRLASYLEDEVLVKLRNDIRSKDALSAVYLDTKGVAGTLRNETVPIAALKKYQDRRWITAQAADDSYWGVDAATRIDGASRVGYWVNPSGRLKEAPRGMAQMSGPAGTRAHREIAARVRDYGKAVGLSGEEQRFLYNNFLMLGTKSEMFGYADELLLTTQFGVAAKHVPDIMRLNPAQQILFKKVFEVLNIETVKARGEVIREAASNNYTITVGREDSVKIPQLQELIQNIANDYAAEITSGARTVATPEEIRLVTNDLIKGTPTTTSQVPGIHFAPKVRDIEDFVVDNKELIQHLVDDIADGVLDINLLEDIVKKPEDYMNKVTLAGIKTEKTGAESRKLARHNLANVYRSYQDNVWKPMTLVGFSYTSRNVAEGLVRVAMLFAEMHQERGFKYSDMFTDFSGANVRKANRRLNKAEAKAWRQNIDEFNNKFDNLTKAMTDEGKKAEDIFLNSQDSLTLSMNGFKETISVLDNFVAATPELGSYLGSIRKSVNLAFKQDIPKGKDASENFINAITSGNYQLAWELSMSMSPAQVSTNLAYIKNQSLETLRVVSRLRDKANLPIGSQKIVQNIQLTLSHINAASDVALLALINRAKARGQLEDYMAAVKLNKPIKVRQGEGLFEPIPGSGYLMDDSYANNAGQLMRGQVSSSASTSSVVLNIRQQIAQAEYNMFAKEELIFPNEIVLGKAVDKVNPAWADAFTEYSNNIYHNDALSVKILSVKNDAQRKKLKAELESWLKSPKSEQWRRELEYEVSRYPSRSDGKSKYLTIVEERMIELDEMYPLTGSNGENLVPLRDKVINRTFTNADALSIPDIDRMPINGVTLAKHDDGKLYNAGRWYRAKVNTIFKYLGTVPEDNFVRFPFYRTVYRNEVRRSVRVLQDAGKNPALYEEQIMKVAHQQAYKEVMERLYSIERLTDLGQTLQYLSPFYMANQNSARFWAGAVSRRPETVVNALKIWNIPNAMGVVYDEYGQQVAYDTPWSAEDSEIIIGLPEKVANFFGSDEISVKKESIDVMFQGRIPGVPSLGGPFVDTFTSNVMRYVSGTAADPDRLAMKMGLGPDFIGSKIIPFYASVKDNPDENIILRSMRAMIGYGSQWKPLMAVGSWRAGKANVLFMTRHDSLYRSELVKAEREGRILTAEEHAKAINNAKTQTIKSLLGEFLFGSSPLVAKPKFRNAQQKERTIISAYIKKYGYEQGILEYGKTATAGEGSPEFMAVLASANIATDNIFGLFSNSESIYNFNQNKKLVAELDLQNSNSSVVGYFMNTGNPSEDYSTTAEEYLYSTTINNKNIKSKQVSTDMFSYELQRRGFNNEYYSYVNAVDLMRAADAQAGTEESEEFYQTLKDERKAELDKKYPTYANEKDFKKQESIINDIRTMYAFTQDQKFMKTVGKNNKNVIAAEAYLYEIRPLLVEDKKNKVKSKKEIDTIKLQFLEDLSAGDPELAKFLQIFFSRDDYTEIDITDVWTIVND